MQLSADPALLLHGQPGSGRDWDAVRAAIAGRVRTLAIDRPGWDGRSRPLGLAGNARFLVHALDREGVGQATVAGHSLGAAVAAWFAAEHPDRVRSLVLAAPSANRESLNRLDELLATPVLGAGLAATVFAGIGMALAADRVRRRVSARVGLPDSYLRVYAQALLKPRTWRSFTVEQRMLVRDLPALEERLSAIVAPTTVVLGTADRIVSPASVRLLAEQIPHAELVELPQASHLLLQERPAEVAELVVTASDGAQKADLVERRRSATAQDSPGSG